MSMVARSRSDAAASSGRSVAVQPPPHRRGGWRFVDVPMRRQRIGDFSAVNSSSGTGSGNSPTSATVISPASPSKNRTLASVKSPLKGSQTAGITTASNNRTNCTTTVATSSLRSSEFLSLRSMSHQGGSSKINTSGSAVAAALASSTTGALNDNDEVFADEDDDNVVLEEISTSSKSNEVVNEVEQLPALNVVEWLQSSYCPVDVVPLVLAFCGPQQAAALSRTNRHWNDVLRQESTWRTMCEGLYKWKVGDPEPASWLDLYRFSPCVPIDYSTIPKALALAAAPATSAPPSASCRFWNSQHQSSKTTASQLVPQIRSVRVMLRPGKYCLKQAIQVLARPNVTVMIETMELPAGLYRAPPSHLALSASNIGQRAVQHHYSELVEQALPLVVQPPAVVPPTVPRPSSHKRGPSFRNLFNCHRSSEPNEETDVEETEFNDEWENGQSLCCNNSNNHATTTPKRATLILRSKLHNEPAFRVQQGLLRLRNLEIQHNSQGSDIWNGNAAVQIQPPLREEDDDDDDGSPRPIPVEPRPTATLHKVHITSKSGRGIVNIDGGKLTLKKCAVTDCAATGVYIGGPGSTAYVEKTDVIRNGVGNQSTTSSSLSPLSRARSRGIARGHSGVYLEQGLATIRQSNVSNNTLTGISVVSPDNAMLTLEDSTLMANGTYQLELPPSAMGHVPAAATARRGSTVNGNIVTLNNVMAVRGEARPRSGLLPDMNGMARNSNGLLASQSHDTNDSLLGHGVGGAGLQYPPPGPPVVGGGAVNAGMGVPHHYY